MRERRTASHTTSDAVASGGHHDQGMHHVLANWRCRVLGHNVSFAAHGTTMAWECRRACGLGGSKDYPTAEDARRYASVFDRRDNTELGRTAPLIGLFPLRLWYRFRAARR